MYGSKNRLENRTWKRPGGGTTRAIAFLGGAKTAEAEAVEGEETPERGLASLSARLNHAEPEQLPGGGNPEGRVGCVKDNKRSTLTVIAQSMVMPWNTRYVKWVLCAEHFKVHQNWNTNGNAIR